MIVQTLVTHFAYWHEDIPIPVYTLEKPEGLKMLDLTCMVELGICSPHRMLLY